MLLAASVVNFPEERVVFPIGVLSIDPPVITALLDEKLLAVTAPAILTVSVDDPIFITSGLVLSVPIFTVFPVVKVPRFITPFALAPAPALIVTDPPVEPPAVVVPAISLRLPPVAATVELAGLTVISVPPTSVEMSEVLFPAR